MTFCLYFSIKTYIDNFVTVLAKCHQTKRMTILLWNNKCCFDSSNEKQKRNVKQGNDWSRKAAELTIGVSFANTHRDLRRVLSRLGRKTIFEELRGNVISLQQLHMHQNPLYAHVWKRFPVTFSFPPGNSLFIFTIYFISIAARNRIILFRNYTSADSLSNSQSIFFLDGNMISSVRLNFGERQNHFRACVFLRYIYPYTECVFLLPKYLCAP